MKLRTYQADSMANVLAMVKRDLGAGAVILHTRTFKRGGVLGFGARRVVEITASDELNVLSPKVRRQMSPTGPAQRDDDNRPPATTGQGTFGDLVRRTYGATDSSPEPSTERAAAIDSPVPAAAPPDGLAIVPSAAAPDEQLTREMSQIRKMVRRMMRNQADRPRGDLPDRLFDHYLALLEQEVTEELAEDVIATVRTTLDEDALNDEQQVREALGKAIAELIPADSSEPAHQPPSDGRPLTIALIGPTGVGKTTTIAKLAATFKLRQKLNVALVTIDTYRIAAVDQLRTYADIIGVPLHVVASPEELRELMEQCPSCRECDVILIDTAGRGQRDDPKLEQLGAFINQADPHEVHLVLSSTCSQHVLMEAAERFGRIRTDRIIFTKLDEAVSFGVLLNVLRRVNKKLSYVTTGQEVPHQIEPGRQHRLAGLILGETL